MQFFVARSLDIPEAAEACAAAIEAARTDSEEAEVGALGGEFVHLHVAGTLFTFCPATALFDIHVFRAPIRGAVGMWYQDTEPGAFFLSDGTQVPWGWGDDLPQGITPEDLRGELPDELVDVL